MIINTEKHLLSFLNSIENEFIEISRTNPEYSAWMGILSYECSNGYKIDVFSDCFCFDYIERIIDENANILFDFTRDHLKMPLISDYYPGDEVVKCIYRIHD